MVVRYLRMLGSVGVFALFMGVCGLSMRFGRFFVVLGGFVVIVFWHFVSQYGEHASGPCPSLAFALTQCWATRRLTVVPMKFSGTCSDGRTAFHINILWR
jgi:hypothetical protein